MHESLKKGLKKITSVFKAPPMVRKRRESFGTSVMHLNFFLLNAALDDIQKGNSKKPLSLFTTEILSSKSKGFAALIRQAESACARQDIELLSYKAFFLRNHLALRRAIQWKFSKYIQTQQEAHALITQMRKTSPETFKQHLITLLKEENLSLETLSQGAKKLEKEWKQAPQKASNAMRVRPI